MSVAYASVHLCSQNHTCLSVLSCGKAPHNCFCMITIQERHQQWKEGQFYSKFKKSTPHNSCLGQSRSTKFTVDAFIYGASCSIISHPLHKDCIQAPTQYLFFKNPNWEYLKWLHSPFSPELPATKKKFVHSSFK